MSDPGLEDVSEPPDLVDLTPEERVVAMVDWFRENFEDPSNETPRDDGEFLYVWGGPFDAEEELTSAFPDAGPDEIEIARDELNGEAFDWAPAGHRISNPQYDDGVEPAAPLAENIGALSGQLIEIERHVVNLIAIQDEARRNAAREVGPGHNNPPDRIEDVPHFQALQESIAEVQSELRQIDPLAQADPDVIARAQSRLGRFVKWLGGGLITLAWEGTKGAAKGAGTTMGTAGGVALLAYLSGIDGGHLLQTATAALDTLTTWGSVLGHAF